MLLGPDFDSPSDKATPAPWPSEEALLALGQNKPIALIVHPGTKLPGPLEAYQTPARFDFMDDTSYADNVHHVVKHLLDSGRGLALPPGDLPYYYKRVSFRFRIDRQGQVEHHVYHQVVARQQWKRLYHTIDTGDDKTPDARIEVLNRDAVEIAVTSSSSPHRLELSWRRLHPA